CVKFGGVAANVDLADLVPAKKKKRKGKTKTPETVSVSLSIKLLGMTGEEAEVELDRYLDRAARAGLTTVEVVHGFGTGRLRAAVHAFMRSHPLVRSFGMVPGNDGATEVTLQRM
ncbi:MAG: endonuclease MutS2, partial [bacterium]|nr:endonuclease MutS2 [bacterium]